MTNAITIERDPRTREVLVRGPDGFTTALEDHVIAAQSLLRVQRLLNEVYEAGHAAGLKERAGLATNQNLGSQHAQQLAGAQLSAAQQRAALGQTK